MAFAGGTGTAQDPYLVATAEQLNDVRNYHDRIVLGGVEVELLNDITAGDAINQWMSDHKIKSLEFYNNGVKVTYANNDVKTFTYVVDEMCQIKQIANNDENSNVIVSWKTL